MAIISGRSTGVPQGISGADPGFFLGGGAPQRNDVTDVEVKKKIKSEYVYTKKKASSQRGGGCTPPAASP